MKSMTELFRFNRADEIEAIDDEGGWKRSIDRVCISSETGNVSFSNLCLPTVRKSAAEGPVERVKKNVYTVS